MKKVPGMYLICTCFHSGTLPTGTGTGTRYFLFTRPGTGTGTGTAKSVPRYRYRYRYKYLAPTLVDSLTKGPLCGDPGCERVPISYACVNRLIASAVSHLGLALLTLTWDKNWDSHSLVNGFPSFLSQDSVSSAKPWMTYEGKFFPKSSGWLSYW